MATEYVLADVQKVSASFEGQSKLIINKVSSLDLTNITPLRKAHIEIGEYEIKNGIPVGKSVASGQYRQSSSLNAFENLDRKSSNPITVDFGQTLRWALGTSSDSAGYWITRVDQAGTYTSQTYVNGVNVVTISSTAHGLSLGESIIASFGGGTRFDGEYVVASVTTNTFTVRTSAVIPTSPGFTVSFYKKPELVPYPDNPNLYNSFRWTTPVSVNGGVSLSTTYELLYSKANDYSVLKINTTEKHWFYKGLKIKISSSSWSLGSTGFSWTGKDGGDVYEVYEVTGNTSFTIVAKSDQSFDGSSSYSIVSGSYAYPEIEVYPEEFSFSQNNDFYSYDSLNVKDSLRHLYSRGQRVGAVDEFTLAIVASPQSSSPDVFGILSEVDNTIYESSSYSFSSSDASSSAPVVSLKRVSSLVTATMASPGYLFSDGDIIRISDCLDPSFNGTFRVESVTSSTVFTYYQTGNIYSDANVYSGNVYVYSSDQDSGYLIGSPFLYQKGSDLYFGDNQQSPTIASTGNYGSYNYPNIYVISAKTDSIDLYVSTQKITYKTTAPRKNASVRKNLVTNSDFETNSNGWNGGTRGNTAGKAFYGSYSYRVPVYDDANFAISSYSRTTAGIITLNFAGDPGSAWAAGDFIHIPNYTTEANWPTMINGAFYGVIKTKSGSTVTIDQNESNMSQSAYTAVTVGSTGGNSAVVYRMGNVYSDYITVDQSDNKFGLSYSAVDLPVSNTNSMGSSYIRFYNSSNTLLSTRFVCTSIPNQTALGQTVFFNRSTGIIENIPSGTAKIRVYIAGSQEYVDAITFEPNPKNFNYFIGNGPKYDLNFAFGRMTGTLDSRTIFSGSLMEIDYWDSAIEYNSVNEVVSKMRTVYGG